MPTASNNAIIGVELTYVRAVEDAVNLAHESGIEFIVMPMVRIKLIAPKSCVMCVFSSSKCTF